MSKARLISVGNELLCGRTVDTNAAWLSGKLFAAGVQTDSVRLVADEIADIVTALRDATARADIVLVTGGLGPTDDDLTRQALAEFLGVELVFYPDLAARIEAYFAGRGLSMPARNRIQAYIPQGASPIDNACGTAPGVLYETADTLIALMPGVPNEMKGMFDATVLPRIARRLGGDIVRSANLRLFGAGESMVAEKLGDRMLRGKNPLLNCTVSEGVITLQSIAAAPTAQQADALLVQHQMELKTLLGELVFGDDEQTLQDAVGQLLKTKQKTLAVAESCTGGLIAKMVTDVAGASGYFQCGWVTYSNAAKTKLLGVPAELIAQHGAVSEPVAAAMARGAAQNAPADCAIAVTGIAGPDGGTPEKPVGLVYIAVQVDGVLRVQECRFPNVGRTSVRFRAAQAALNLLRLRLG